MKIVGYHGTTYDAAVQIKNGVIEDPSESYEGSPSKKRKHEYRWLGRGLYFFQECRSLAEVWAKSKKGNTRPAVCVAEIDLNNGNMESIEEISKKKIEIRNSIDLISTEYFPILKSVYSNFITEMPGELPSQQPLTIIDGVVVESRSDDGKRFGWNALDYAVIEALVAYFEHIEKQPIGVVRAIFIEGREVYKNSYIYDGAHICVVVRSPYNEMKIIEQIELN